LNKVYVIGLNLASATLDAVAKAGGTTSARLATSQAEIEAALADIVQSSVLVEYCNQKDDDCNNICDDPYPDVAEPAGCAPAGTPGFNADGSRNAKSCDNGQLAGTHCFASGQFQCAPGPNSLSESCSAPTCGVAGCPGAAGCSADPRCPTLETASGCNAVDDDCNGVVDDCDGTVDNIPASGSDVGLACGQSVGMCESGVTACCDKRNLASCT